MAVEVFMPKMSDHMEFGEIIAWRASEGDRVEKGQVILEVMTDKAVAEMEAPSSGILKGIRPGCGEGAQVPVGETVAFIAAPDEEVPALPLLIPAGMERVEAERLSPSPTPTAPPRMEAQPGQVRATPVARRVAEELGVDLSSVKGTGPGGQIKGDDVRAFAEAQRARSPAKEIRAAPAARRLARELGVDLAQVEGTGPGGRIKVEDVHALASAFAATAEEGVEWLDLTPIQRLTGQRMLQSVQTAPQFALTIDVDMTDTLRLRESLTEQALAQTGTRLSVTAILVKVVAQALRRYPRANASFENGRIKLHQRVNVGVAVGTDDGLVVPVVKDADQKTLIQINRELRAFHEKAQQMRFSTEELAKGTFTISNLGMYGVDRFWAIVNPPESAILAVGRIVKTPVGMPDDTVALRPMMTLTLSVDHRSLDGVQGARLLAEIRDLLENPIGADSSD